MLVHKLFTKNGQACLPIDLKWCCNTSAVYVIALLKIHRQLARFCVVTLHSQNTAKGTEAYHKPKTPEYSKAIPTLERNLERNLDYKTVF